MSSFGYCNVICIKIMIPFFFSKLGNFLDKSNISFNDLRAEKF